MTAIHVMTPSLGLFPSSVAWCCMYRKNERKLNAFITDYTNLRYIIYKNARYVPFTQCLR